MNSQKTWRKSVKSTMHLKTSMINNKDSFRIFKKKLIHTRSDFLTDKMRSLRRENLRILDSSSPSMSTTSSNDDVILQQLMTLTSAISTKSKDPLKIKIFPKFQGDDTKEFDEWYEVVISILVTSEWESFYFKSNDDIFADDTKESCMNEYLFSAIELCFEGNDKSTMSGNKYLRGNDLTYPHSMKQRAATSVPDVSVFLTVFPIYGVCLEVRFQILKIKTQNIQYNDKISLTLL